MSNVKKLMMTAAGGDALNVEDVFSTFIYDGTSSAQTITNGIDLDGEGGLVWTKNRDTSGYYHNLIDTERGISDWLRSDATNGNITTFDNAITSFNSDGYSLGTDTYAYVNNNGKNYASWTFRKAPKFFDVVTYTGNGSTQNISHSLGSVPGTIIVKKTNSTANWITYHRSLGNDKAVFLNLTSSQSSSTTYWNATTPTDSVFSVGANGNTNGNGDTFVAYIFAHNDGDGDFGPTGDQDIIKCGSYTGNGSTPIDVDLGFEPQWVMIKNVTRSVSPHTSWFIVDNMRGATNGSGGDAWLRANTTDAETVETFLFPYATGFQVKDGGYDANFNGDTYVYMAIRRDPMAVPESASDVFDVTAYTADNTDNRVIATDNKVDLVLARNRSTTSERGFNVGDRLRGLLFLGTEVVYGDGGDSDSFMGFDHMTGFEVGNDATRRLNYSNYTQIAYTWTRAPNFFDIVSYKGNGSTQAIDHNLGVVPEMIWIKNRVTNIAWAVYHKDLGNQEVLFLNDDQGDYTQTSIWNSTTPTSTQFTVGTYANTVNESNTYHIAYLFASLDGVSKVGSYTGNGSSQTIDCGFSSGARFVLIKRTDASGSWNVFDTERGIVAGNDPILYLDSTSSEYTGYDSIDPHTSGFIINQLSNTYLNASGASYMFYAIA